MINTNKNLPDAIFRESETVVSSSPPVVKVSPVFKPAPTPRSPNKSTYAAISIIVALFVLFAGLALVYRALTDNRLSRQEQTDQGLAEQLDKLKQQAQIANLEVKQLQADQATIKDLVVTESAQIPDLEVSGTTNMAGNLTVDSHSSFSSLDTTGNLTVGSNLTTNGTSVFQNTITANTNLNVNNNLVVGGSSNLQSVVFNSTTNNNGRVYIDDNAQVTGSLFVDGSIHGNIAGTINPNFTQGSVIFQDSNGLAQNNTNFFWDDTNNRLGIGTNTPTYSLDVIGGSIVARFGGRVIGSDAINPNEFATLSQVNFTSSGSFIHNGNSFGETAVLGTNDNFGLAIETNGTERLRIDTSGNVGIGTSNPTYKLDIIGNANSQIHLSNGLSDSGGYLTSDGAANFFVSGGAAWNGSTWDARSTSAQIIGGHNGTLTFYTDPSLTAGNPFTPTARVRIASNGNFGIGTLTFSGTLGTHVTQISQTNSAGGGPELLIHNPGQGASAASILSFGGKQSGVEGYTAFLQTMNTGLLSIGTAPASNGFVQPTTRLTIDGTGNFAFNTSQLYVQESNGNIGIGTASPGSKLHLTGAEARIQADNSFISFYNTAGTRRGYLQIAEGADLRVVQEQNQAVTLWTNNSEKVRVTSSGNVGIGNINPPDKLTVNGDTQLINNSLSTLRIGAAQGIAMFQFDTTNQKLYFLPTAADAGNTIRNSPTLDLRGAYWNGASSTQLSFLLQNVVSSTTPDYRLAIVNNSGSELLSLLNGGNLGIGTSSPLALLSVGSGSPFQVNTSGQVTYVSGATDTVAYVCRNSGGQLAACSGTSTGSAFVQGGNSFGAAATLGTNDNFSLNFETNNTTYYTLNTSGLLQGSNSASISVPGSGSSSERFGLSTTASGANSTAIGNSATASDANATALGRTATASGHSSVAIGQGATASTTKAIAIGQGSNSAFSRSIALGTGATTTAANQIVVGGASGDPITSGFFGSGVTAVSPQDFTMNASGGSGTDIAGASLFFAGGRGTGTGLGGSINFQTALASGVSGSSLNALTTRMTILQNGNIGIGTPAPTIDFDITKTSIGSTLGQLIRNSDNTSGTSNSRLQLLTGGGSGGDPQLLLTVSGVTDWNLGVDNDDSDKLKIGNGSVVGNNTRFTIQTDGNVGIGTTAPGYILDVARDIGTYSSSSFNAAQLNIDNPTAQANSAAAIRFRTQHSNNAISYAYIGVSATSTGTGDIFFAQRQGSSAVERMRIAGGGNVGIGTTTPASRLDIDPTATFGAAGVSGITQRAHTVTLSGANPTTYPTFYASQIGEMTLTGTNPGQTVTDAAGLVVAPPIKSNNVTLTNTHGVLIPTTAVSAATNAYGLTVNTPTGASNNYAAAFLGGNVGVGTSTPTNRLHVVAPGAVTALNVVNGGTARIASFESTGNSYIDIFRTGFDGLRLSGSSGGPYIGTGGSGAFIALGINDVSSGGSTAGGVGVGGIVSTAIRGALHTKARSATDEAVIIQGFDSTQTADLLSLWDSSSNILAQFKPVSSSNQRQQFFLYNTLETTPTNYERLAIYPDSTNNIFRIDAQNSGTGVLRNISLQTTGGNVGIGTTSPGAPLDVRATGGASAINISTNGASDSRIQFQDGTTDEWYIGRIESNNSLQIVESGVSTRMILLEGGNVGVGATSPTSLFHVNRSQDAITEVLVQNANTGTSARARYTLTSDVASATLQAFSSTFSTASLASTVMLNTTGSIPLLLGTAGAERMRIDSSGNVGIGTTAPGNMLHIHNTSAVAVGQTITNSTSGSTSNDGMFLGLDGAAVAYLYQRENLAMHLGTNNTSRLTISNIGNVGIGTTSPGSSLDIIGSVNTQLRVADTTTDATVKIFRLTTRHYTNTEEDFLVFEARSGSATNTLAIGGSSNAQNSAGLITFYTAANNTTTTGTERMRIDSSGNVGVGTTSPGARLGIYNNTSSSDVDIFRVLSDVGSAANVKFRIDSDGDIFTDGSTTIGTPADVAENYQNSDGAKPGDVVVFANNASGIAQVAKSTTTNQHGLAGVVSTAPGIILSGNTVGVSVALAGRVPTNVSTANGSITTGDYLTSGPDGKAVKATNAGPIIGTALESATQDGTIEVFIHPGHYYPTGTQTLQGQNNNSNPQNSNSSADFSSINVSGLATINELKVTGSATIASNLTVRGIISVAKIVINGHVSAGSDTAGEIVVGPDVQSVTRDFSNAYTKVPEVVISPKQDMGNTRYWVEPTRTGFTVRTSQSSDKVLKFSYFVIEGN